MEVDKILNEIMPSLKSSLISEIRTALMNGIKDELAELISEKLLSDEKNSFKNKILKEVADRKKIDETIKELEGQIASKDLELIAKENELKAINNKKIIKKVVNELEFKPHNLEMLEGMIDTKGDIKEEQIKKQIEKMYEDYPFMFFKQSNNQIQGNGDIINKISSPNNNVNFNAQTTNSATSIADEIKSLYGGFQG